MKRQSLLVSAALLGAMLPPAAAGQPKPAPAKSSPAWAEYIEDEFWARVNKSMDPEDFQAYIDAYPSGSYLALAKFELARIKRGQARVPAHALAGSGGSAAGAGTAAPQAQAPTPAPAPALRQDPDFPIDEGMMGRIANDPMLAVPDPVQHGPVRVEGVRNVPIKLPNGSSITSRMPNKSQSERLPDSPLCRIANTLQMGEASFVQTNIESEGLAWAGLLPLSVFTKTRATSKAGEFSGTQLNQYRIENLSEPFFPLTPGKHIDFDHITRTLKSTGSAADMGAVTMHYSCRAGEAVDAGSISTSWSGPAVPLRCEATMRAANLPETKQAPVLFHWIERNGCFIQDAQR